MPGSTWIRVGIAGATGLALVTVWFQTGEWEFTFARTIIAASTVVVLLLLAFDLWLWRVPGVRRLAGRPVLHGTWRMELNSSYEGLAGAPMVGYLVVRQTYSRIRADMLFEYSDSDFRGGDLLCDAGRWRLSYTFISHPHALHQTGNPPSRGAADLRVGARPSVHLVGDYWMERGSKGRVASSGHSPVHHDTFASASVGEYR